MNKISISGMMATWGMVLSSPLLHAAPVSPRFEVNYFYDKPDASLVLNDLVFSTARSGLACGYFVNTSNDKRRQMLLATTDAGATWTELPAKDTCLSLSLAPEGVLWMVGEKGVWKSQEAGRDWKKVLSEKNLLKAYFLTAEHGWAIGGTKQVFETRDGGGKWTPVAAAATPKSIPERTVYASIAFANQKRGLIVGYSSPSADPHLPDWIDPAARDRPQVPNLSVMLDTRDGGETWQESTVSIFGRITKFALSPTNTGGLGLVEFTQAFAWPSEVYRVSPKTGKSERAFREKDRRITDILISASGTAYMAGVSTVGSLYTGPVPGKLKVYRSDDLETWTEIPVDYRAEARYATLADSGDGIWVATDLGMILKLNEK